MTTPACTLFSRFGILLAAALAVSAAIGADRVLAADPVSLPSASPQQPIKDRLEASASLVIDGVVVDRALLVSIYAKRAYAPVWIGHPERGAEFLAALERAPADGIDPESLGASAVRSALGDPAIDATDRELLLSDRYIAYGAALAQGRVQPDLIEDDWALARPGFDAAAALEAAESGPGAALDHLRPRAAAYERLRQALRHYDLLAAQGGWAALPAGTKLKPGDKGSLVSLLRRRLAIEGDLPPQMSEGDAFDGRLAAALRSFQRRHGLAADARIGPKTLAALNIAAGERADQIRINLERERSMPRDRPATRVEVETAAQSLVFYRDGKPVLSSRTIVGDALHPTPVVGADIRSVVLNPPWDVPASIIRREIQPRLVRDPGYLARNHFVLLGRTGGDASGQDVDWRSTDILAAGWRLRQLPGPWNALGVLLLDMPNRFDVYLHDTPARSLFAAVERTLSHGCVRVEKANELASALLAEPKPTGDPHLDTGETRRIPLGEPVPVFLLYRTAFVDDDGTVEFRDDIYGRDRRLMAALSATASPAAALRVSARTACPDIGKFLVGMPS